MNLLTGANNGTQQLKKKNEVKEYTT